MRQMLFAMGLILAASPVAVACPHGQLLRVHLSKCVSLSSPLALAYERPLRRTRLNIRLPADPPLPPSNAVPDLPLPDPDPATTKLNQELLQ